MTVVKIPETGLVVLIGASGSGKSTFARRCFASTEVISSDFCRGLVSDDENDQSATNAAFEVLHFIVGKRLEGRRLAVVDATNVQPEARKGLIALARRHHVLAVAVVLEVPEKTCAERNASRPDRDFGPHVIRNQLSQLRRSMKGLRKEGFHRVHVLSGEDEIANATFERERLWNDRRSEVGPFDIIGDLHGCLNELVDLLTTLGYEVSPEINSASHPEGRQAIFLGDLVDRGPATPGVLRLVMGMVEEGKALCIPGNHEVKLLKALQGRNVTVSHGLAESLEQLKGEDPDFTSRVVEFIDTLIGHYVLDSGKLVVAHAGLPADMHGRASAAVRSFALYGDTTGETDEYGLPVRYPWADDYRGEATVVYGHTPVPQAEWVNKTICIDTGCVFGGRLTALRYPEGELVSVPARAVYYEPVRPFGAAMIGSTPEREPTDLDLDDVIGKRIVETRVTGKTVTIREENGAAALETMSRFAIDPRWLIYLPPTMAPTATSEREGLLEHPFEAFASFRAAKVAQVICEEKHMGSRAVVVVCRDDSVPEKRFKIPSQAPGVVFTRTGRPFFPHQEMERELLSRVRTAVESAGIWEELGTDWIALDCELMPWSFKAEDLLKNQYAAVGAAAPVALGAEVAVLEKAIGRDPELAELLAHFTDRRDMVQDFVESYRPYCWPVSSLDDLSLAPFQFLASEGEVLAYRGHTWHIELADRLAGADETVFRRTRSLVVNVDDAQEIEDGVKWWEEMTSGGGEGMVVKPVQPVQIGPKGLIQPGIKCRGRNYLRLIYGPEYTAERHLSRLRARGLGLKRSLAVREFALGIEALERFVANEPLYRVHECVFGVLALESEPVDPRL